MELQYPSAIAGTVKDIVRIGEIDDRWVFLLDVRALRPAQWMALLQFLMVHIATRMEKILPEDPEGPMTREDIFTGFAAFLLDKARSGTAFEGSDEVQGFDPKTGKSTAGEA